MEDIKLLVQEEGRSARNLVAFNVPVVQTQCDSNLEKVMRRPPTSPRSVSEYRKDDSRCKRSRDSSQSGSRVRSASTGRDKKSELHARYWAFLFGNLQRAVDEIYQTCEADESVTECKEVIMVLNNYTREFTNLINWFKIKWEYETTPPPQRPRSLAWEIRKSSPGKIRYKSLEPISSVCLKSPTLCKNSAGCLIFDHQSQLNSNKQLTLGIKEETENLTSTVLTLQNSSNMDLVPEMKTNSVKDCHLVSPDDSEALISENSELPESEDKVNCVKNFIPQSDSGPKLKSPITEFVMVDEICQTDPEKDVDENGPKFRSSGQQTCSVLTAFSELKMQDKEDLNSMTENQVLKRNPSSGSKTSKSKLSEEDTKTSFRTGALAGANKTSTSLNQGLNSANSKTSSQNSYSLATISQTKTTNLVQTTSIISAGRLLRPSLNTKTSITNCLKQSGRLRPLPLVTGKVTNVCSSIGKSVQPVSEVQGIKMVKQTLSEKKMKSTADAKDNKIYVKNLNSNKVLKSLDVSQIKHDNSRHGNRTSRDNTNDEDDGWVKVRSRSRFSPATRAGDLGTSLSRSASNLKSKGEQKISKMVHKTRFHQPSSAISLPTLAFSNSYCKENIPIKKPVRSKTVANNKFNENLKSVFKLERNKVDEINNKKKNGLEKVKKNCSRLINEKIIIENSDKNEYNRMEKVENAKNISLNNETDDLRKTTTFDQDAIDEDENHFHEEIKKNKEKEEMLQKEINDLEAADLEVDLETGDEETDGEATTGTEEELDQEKKLNSSVIQKKTQSLFKSHPCNSALRGISWADHMDTLDELEKLVVQDCSNKGMTKDEQMDTLERLEEFVARHPGRALELHQKLSSPSRRRTMLDTVKRFQARQAKASEKREQLKMEKAQKLRELLKKVDEVKAAKDKLIEERRQRLEMKLKRAAENRNLHLKEIMRKAHDEEEKLKEIAFINELEAQNKRHDFMTQCQEQEGRLQGIHEERQRKQEEKAAKEAAFEERRKAIEAERQEKLEKMQERQRKRDEQADKKKQEKEKERQELAREKARDRSERLEALHAAQLEAQEELQKKIQQKQEDYARRHEENIEQIRQKALELSILKCSDDIAPKLAPYEVQKLCTACNVLIGSEVYLLSHIRGKKHQENLKNQINGKDLAKEEMERYNIKIIVNAPSDKIDPKISLDRERLKSFKKKSKKIRLRMISKGEAFMSKLENPEKFESPGKGKLQKCLKDIEKVIKSQGKGQWSDCAITTLERSMGEISRLLNKQNFQDQLVFRYLNGFGALNSILQLDMEVPPNMTPYLPQKCFVTTSSAFLAAINKSSSNCKFIIFSNYVITLLDLLMKRLTVLIPEHSSMVTVHYSKSLPFDPVASVLLRLLADILMFDENSDSDSDSSGDFLQRLQDIISYSVSSGIVDKLAKYCKSVRDPVDEQPSSQFLLNILQLLTTLTIRCKTVRQGEEDPTQLLATLQVTELVGAVSILYGMLLHQGSPPRLVDATLPTLSPHIIAITVATIRLLRSVAELDLQMFQSILGAEGISLQFRHIASYLLWYCCQDREKVLLHEVIAIVGYFAVFHRDNQMILQSGSTPTVLQQLCNLPFPYFSNPELSVLLFPTLLACCCDNEENKAILEQEISYSNVGEPRARCASLAARPSNNRAIPFPSKPCCIRFMPNGIFCSSHRNLQEWRSRILILLLKSSSTNPIGWSSWGGCGGCGGSGSEISDPNRTAQQCLCRFAPSPRLAATLADHQRHRVVPSLVVNLGPSRQIKISPVKIEDMSDQPQKKRRLSLCVGCGAQIHDQYILKVAPDLEWHAACLKCAECHQFLDENCTCFVRDGKTYCKRDYVRLFGTKCNKCGLGFSKNDYVMRAKTKIYHVDCFRCTACERHLVPGDEFALREDGLFCKEDHEVLDKTCTGEHNNNNTNVNNNNSNSVHNEGSNSDSSESGSNKGRDSSSCRSGGGTNKVSSDGKPTRVRTVLNEKQLHTLRTCYAANPRPDALMKEQLVEMTGLSPRVIRVWFQNKRCKDKKRAILMKQQLQQEKDGRKLGYGGMQGIPMVASSPVRHESPLGLNPIEVHSYQPPWKALSDFALHTDLDRLDPAAPPFQHLVNQMHGYDIHGPPTHHDLGPPPNDVGHPDSTDSYVTYLESDDEHDGSSP